MADIRPLKAGDLPAISKLVHTYLTPDEPPEEITSFLRATLLDDPWRDDELPSLVATDDGEVIGFIGSQPRRFRFGDRELRGVCCSHLSVAEDRRAGAAGALLLRRLLTAGQDFTYSDTANEDVARMFTAFGGHLDNVRACDWMIVTKPLRWVRTLGTDAVRRRLGRGRVPVGAFPFQALRPRSGRWALPEADPEVSGEDVGSAAIVESLPLMAKGIRLRADYDEQFLDHVFEQGRLRFGTLVRRLVRRGDRAIGWYAYVQRPGGVNRILHLLTSDRDADAVLGDLLRHSAAGGGALLAGRHEPHLTSVLERWLPVLGFARRPVIHSHDAEIRATLATRDSLLTQLDSEWFVT